MTRTLSISNVFCHEFLEIGIPAGATLITGENSSGKTSIARVLAALTTHTTNPAKLSAALAKTYLRQGAVEGYATLSDGPTWILPAKMEVPAGVEPETGLHMVGVVDFIGSPGSSITDRAAIYESLFLPDNPADLLRPVWKQSEQQLETVLDIIKKKGWKTAAALYDEQKREAGRSWGNITGQRYTKKRGPLWRPEDWQADMEGLSEDDVLTALTEAQDALRAAGVRHAVAQDRVDRGVEARDEKVPAQEAVVQALKEEVDALEAELEPMRARGTAKKTEETEARNAVGRIQNEITGLKAVMGEEVPEARYSCPECGAPLEWENGALVHFKPPEARDAEADAARLNELQGKLHEAEQKLEGIEGEFAEMQEAFSGKRSKARLKADEYNQAMGVLREYRRQAEDANLTAGDSNEAERSILENNRDRADARRKAWVANRDAQLAHQNYVEYEMVAALLGPTGARATHMKGQMDRVRSALASISARSGWMPITITEAYEVVSGGYPAVLAAENEKRKCQWAIQAALAMLNRDAHWLVLDAADLLRGQSWEGLEALVGALVSKRPDLHVVVCATETVAPAGWHAINLSEAA